ncbi:MAG: hypothetical protein EBU93_07715, partial [Chlamydiae bacterium]|nr:hypothetical protein [Chlamydiota bacterium]
VNESNFPATAIQNALVIKLKSEQPVIIPASWFGHAFVLIFKKVQGKDSYDMTVINTGRGLEFHHWLADTNKVYFALPRFWLEFKNIPKDVLFSDDAWFFLAMKQMNIKESSDKLKEVSGTLPAYFYGSLLSNFKDYFQEPDSSSSKLKPAQRSGTCTISSLMAALLYSVKDEVEFYKSTVIIGHKMLENWLNEIENDPDYTVMFSDGYDSTARKIFKSTASSLAHQLLSYFEKRFPDGFLNFALIGGKGEGRKLPERMEAAVEALNKSPEDLVLLKKTVNFASKILKIVKKIKINEESRKIDLRSALKKYQNYFVQFSFETDAWADDDSETLNSLNLTVDRPSDKIGNLNSLNTAISKC